MLCDRSFDERPRHVDATDVYEDVAYHCGVLIAPFFLGGGFGCSSLKENTGLSAKESEGAKARD